MPEPLLTSPQFTQDDSLPEWWTKAALDAWETFQSLPMPRRVDEDWRFASIQSLSLDAYTLPEPFDPEVCESVLALSTSDFDTTATAVFANDELLAHQPLPEELAQKGVIWEPITSALSHHEELLRRYFMEHTTTLGAEKFAALHRARCCSGMLLYVPKGVEIEHPFSASYWLGGEGSSVFPHTLVIAEANSRVLLSDAFRSVQETAGFAVGVCDLVALDGASIQYVSSQDWSGEAVSMHINSVHVGRDATVKTLLVNTGSHYARVENQSSLVGQGARSEMLSLTVGDRNQEFDQRTLQQHSAPNTWSDLLYKNALNFQSKSIFKGMIRVDPAAPHTDAYQTNHNLLLNPEAEADSMPGLEILNDEVKCSHGATTGQIDESQLFYMLARGVDRETAKKLFTFGFFEEVLKRFNHEGIHSTLRQQVEEKFLGSCASSSGGASGGEEIDATDVRQLQGTK